MDHTTIVSPAQQTPVFQRVYALYLTWYQRSQTLPKKDRFTIGQKIENSLLESAILLVTAYHTTSSSTKKTTLSRIDMLIEGIKIQIRLAKDIRAIDKRAYIEYQSALREIGKMLGGWIVSIQK